MGSRHADVEARLLKLLELTNDWLKYAEAKNGVAVGLASAGTAGTLSVLNELTSRDDPAAAGVAVLLILAEAVMVTSLGLALYSFLPKTDLAAWVAGRRGRPAGEDNLYFYGHLAKYAPDHLAAAVARRYEGAGRDEPAGEAAHDLAAQIVTNARITLWKLRFFVPALAGFGLGVLLTTVAVVLSAV